MLFDLDDTLIDRRIAFHRWARASVPRWLDSSASEGEIVDATESLIHLDNDGFMPRSEFFSEVKERYPKIEGTAEELVVNYYRDILPYISLVDGAHLLLETLRSMAVPFGIVTNGGPHQMDKAVVAGLAAQASCILISDQFGARKPNSSIFLAAAQQLGVPASEAVFVGDQPNIDVIGAHTCGMRTVWLKNGRTWPKSLPSNTFDLAVDSLSSLTVAKSRQ
jgi:putative hydrolase of the HAD superfamily